MIRYEIGTPHRPRRHIVARMSAARSRVGVAISEYADGRANARAMISSSSCAMENIAGWRLNRRRYLLTICTEAGGETPAPETCEAIRNAATTAGKLISLRT